MSDPPPAQAPSMLRRVVGFATPIAIGVAALVMMQRALWGNLLMGELLRIVLGMLASTVLLVLPAMYAMLADFGLTARPGATVGGAQDEEAS